MPLDDDISLKLWAVAHEQASISAEWLDEETDSAERLGLAIREAAQSLRARGMANQGIASCLIGVVIHVAFDDDAED